MSERQYLELPLMENRRLSSVCNIDDLKCNTDKETAWSFL